MHNNTKAIIWMLIHVITAALMAMIYRILTVDVSKIHVSFFLNLAAFILILPYAIWNFKYLFKTYFWYIHFGRAFCLITAQLILIYVYNNMKFAQVAAITLTYPLFCTASAAIFLDEKIGISRITALLIGFIGALIVINPSYNEFSLHSIYALIAVVLWVGFDVITKKHEKKESILIQLFYTILFMFLLSSIPASLVHAPHISFEFLQKIPYLGLLVIAYVVSGILAIIEAEGVGVVLPFYFLVMVLSSAIGYFIFDEIIAVSTIFGASIILISTGYIGYREHRVKMLQDMQKQGNLI